MYLLELAAQNVRGMSPQVRAQLKPGYVVLKAQGEKPPPLAAVALAVLFPETRGGDSEFAVPGAKAKVAISVIGNDQTAYRVLRELGATSALQRLNRQTQAFETLSENNGDILQALRAQVGFPGKPAFEQLFTLHEKLLPSRRPRGWRANKRLSSLVPEEQGPTETPEEKLARLEQEHALAKEVEQLQFDADGITHAIFKAEAKLKGAEGLRAALTDAETEWRKAPSPEKFGLPADIVQRAQAYPDLVKRRDEQLAKVASEPQEYDWAGPAAPKKILPVWKDPRFQGAIGGGIAVLALGLFLTGSARYVALLDIPAFGFAAILALRWVEEVEEEDRSGRITGVRAAREKKVRDEFEQEARYVKAAMTAVGVDEIKELVDAFGAKALLRQKVDEYRAQVEEYEGHPEFVDAQQNLPAMRERQQELNAIIEEKGSYVRDVREIEREIDDVRAELEGPAYHEAGAGGEGLEDPCPPILAHAAELVQLPAPTVAAAAKDRCAQYLSALTDRRYVGVEFDTEGNAIVTQGGAGAVRRAVKELSARDVDLLYLALRLTLIERVCTKVKLPVLLEDCFPLEDAKLPLLARMLKHLGTLTQVVHVTASPAFPPVSDLAVNI